MFYYFGYDALGSQVIVLNNSGSIVGSQLYGPYGNQRYSAGTLPTSIGFTGQHTDSLTGLDYYNARYYDPAVGVFLAPDWIQGNILGMSPYTYVAGNPETLTDPTGLCGWDDWGDCFTQVEQVVEQAAPIIVPAVASTPFWIPLLIAGGIGLGLGIVLGVWDFVANTIHGADSSLNWRQWQSKQGSSHQNHLPPPDQNAQQRARHQIHQLEQERQSIKPKPRAYSKLRLSNGDEFKYGSYRYQSGNPPQASPDYGRVDTRNDPNGGKKALCAEARCMQAAQDKYGNNPPQGFNEMWETQDQGRRPCDYNVNGGCTPGLGNFSKRFGPTRVWWIDDQGFLHSQDFVGGQAGPVQVYP